MTKKLMLKQLASMLASFKRKKKYYCEVEYLKASGAQYIDTGIEAQSGVKARISFEWGTGDIGQDKYVLAAAHASKGRCYFGTYQSKWMYGYSQYWQEGEPQADVKYDAEVSWEINNQYLKINGETLISQQISTELDIPGTLYMFARNQDNPGWYSNAKIYCCQMWKDGVLVRDFIPVLDWNMKPAMYDKVTDGLYYNLRQNVNDFTYGREIHYVDYLESTGTQYIDTGITPTFTLTSEVKYQASVPSVCPLGAGSTSSISNDRYQIIASTAVHSARISGATRTNDGATYDELVEATLKASNKMFTINDTSINIAGDYSSLTTNTITLFRRNMDAGEALIAAFVGDIYWVKLTDNDVLLRDFVPAVDENGVGYMLDKITHTIFDNAGTGSFEYPSVELKYLLTDGTPYIDSGLTGDSDTKMEMVFDITQQSSENRGIMGSRVNANTQLLAFGYGTDTLASDFNNSSYSTYRAAIKYQLDTKYRIYTSKEKRTVIDEESGTVLKENNTLCKDTMSTGALLVGAETGLSDKHVGHIYSAKIWSDSTLVRDYVPCFKGGITGMWDKVNEVFYSDPNGNAFSVGKIVESEYLE